MKKLTSLLLLALSTLSCNAQNDNTIVSNFNSRAAQSFIENYNDSKELGFLSKTDQCILSKTIVNYLDELNNWSMTIIDSFYVRSYVSPDLTSQFSFVATKDGKFYFIYIPQFHDRYFNKKYFAQTKKNHIELKDSIGCHAVKLKTEMFDEFLEKELTSSKKIHDQVNQADHLLQPLFRQVLGSRVPDNLLIDSLSKRPKGQYDEIMKSISTSLSSKEIITTWDRNYQVYRNALGFILVDFTRDPNNKNRLKINFYLIPDQRQYKRYVDVSIRRFVDCLKL